MITKEVVMEEFDRVNERVKDSINAFLEDAPDYPANTISEFNKD